MNDDWIGATRQGLEWGPPAAGRSARPALPWKPAGLRENGVRFLLVTDDEALAAALQSRLHAAGHAAHWSRQWPLASHAPGHEALIVDERLWQVAEAAGAAGSSASLPLMLLSRALPHGSSAMGLQALADSVLAWTEQTVATMPRRMMDGELLVDTTRQSILLNGAPVELTPFEWQVIALLATQPDRVVPREEIARLIGGDAKASDNAVAVHLYNLRRKLGRHAIETIRGRGFRLRP
jgi:DNA-binding response OmpR family regulator